LLPKYARNKIRLDVLPFLGQYNSGITESLNHLAEVIGEEDDYIQQKSEQVYKELVFVEGGVFTFRLEPFVKLHAALQRRLIKLILNYLPLGTEENDFVKIEAIRKGAVQDMPTTWNLDLGSGIRCKREYDMIRFVPSTVGKPVSPYTYLVEHFPAEVSISGTEYCLRFSLHGVDNNSLPLNTIGNEEAVFDADKLLYPLTMRSRLPGDSMKVMGLNGSKKVKDIFIDAKIPPSSRSQIPMVTDAEGHIIWIPGVRRSEIATVSKHTSSVLRIVLDTRSV
jgi:tRNA(Ile)-lysidine synthase